MPNWLVRSTDFGFHCVNDKCCFVAIHLNRLEVFRSTSGTKIMFLVFLKDCFTVGSVMLDFNLIFFFFLNF